MALRNPSSMLGDVFQMLSDDNPKFREEMGRLRRTSDLAEPLGGEFTFAIDGPILPLPSWKFAVEVYDPSRLQWAIEQFATDSGVSVTKDQVGDRTYYALTTDKLSYEIDYVYVDGYLLAAPSRTLLNKAIQNRETGYVLSRSDSFRAQLPKDGRLNFSALIYHNVGSAIGPIASQLSEAPAELKTLAANATPGLIYAYGEPDRIVVATGGTFFGLDLNALALPNLLHMGAHSPQMNQQQRLPKQLHSVN